MVKGRVSSKQDELQNAKGIDVGTVFVSCAEKKGDEVIFRSERDSFFEIDYSDFTKEMLISSKVKYIQQSNTLYVVGDESLKFANIFHKDTRRPLSKGIISPTEKEALPMVEFLIKSIVGKPEYEREIAYYSVPGLPLDAELNIFYHERLLKDFLTKLGYTAKPINEGLAVVFSELEDDGFTGIGLSFGGGMVNMCFSFMSVPIFTFSLTKAGDWIDQQVAIAVGETASRICAIKESTLDLTKAEGLTNVEKALSIHYDYLIEYVIEHIKREFEKTKNMPRIDRPISIVLSGGTALPNGLAQRFKKILNQAKFPLEVGEVKMAYNPVRSVAAGALVAAMADEAKIR